MLSKLILLAILFASISLAQTTEGDSLNTGIVYGDDHAFAVSAPEGWVLDNSSSVNQGLHAVFYPKSGSWKTSPSVMYVNTSNKRVKGNETLEKLMAFDIEQSQKRDSSIKIADLSPVTTKDKKQAKVK